MALVDLLKLGPASAGWRIEKVILGDNIPTWVLGTGTADATTFLRGDLTWATPPGGSFITSVANTPTINLAVGGGQLTAVLANTAVAAGSYGNATNVGSFTVNAQGQLTAAANVPITFPAAFITAISDTNSIDLTVGAGTLSADVLTQNTATINLSINASGLKADFASMNISQFTNNSNYITLINLSAVSPVTYNNTTGVISTLMNTNRLIGRSTAGAGVFEEIILGTGLSFTGSTLNVSGVGGETLAQTLAIGNTTGGNDITISDGDFIQGSGSQVQIDFGSDAYLYLNLDAGAGLLPYIDIEPTFLNLVGVNGSGAGVNLGALSTGITHTTLIELSSASTKIGSLAGVGTRMVTTNATGVLSTAAIPLGTVTSVSATSPLTSTGGTTPDINTSMSTNKLIGRGTAGTGVFEEITLGTNLSLSGTTLNVTGAGVVPAALSKADDTNVTLTLSGTPLTALLQAVTITAGWTGTLADARITNSANWNTAYTNRITSLTTTGSSGVATLVANVLNIPDYSIAGLSPLTTKGDLFTFSTVNTRLGIGADATLLMADAVATTGNKWIAFSGDATVALTGVVTLASTIVAGGPTGSATISPIITYDAKGRLTTVSSATITPAVGSITGLGTGVAAALAVNVGSSGAFVTNGGALGTPSSGTLTNATGLPITSVTGLTWTDYSGTSTVTGFSSTTEKKIYYMTVGKMLIINAFITGTSNTTGFTFTIPTAASANVSSQSFSCITKNGGSNASALVQVAASSTTMTVFQSATSATFTASGVKACFLGTIIIMID